MSTPSGRPAVPRPTVRQSSPPASPAAAPAAAREAYVAIAPVIRDRLPTLELEDGDLVVEEQAVAPRALVRRSTPPPPPPLRSTIAPAPESSVQVKDGRLDSMLDPSEALFDGMYDLNYADSAWHAARICASTLGRALRARSVIIHAHDLASRQLRAIGVHGDGEFDVLGSSDASDDDLVASAVICNQKPVTLRFDGELPRLAPRRHAAIGAPRTVVAVPALAWGRCVGIIEIIDADDRLASRVADAAGYVAERLAAFLSEQAAA